MYRIKMTYAKNIIVALIGVFVGFGLGPLSPWLLLIYGIAGAFIFLTRTKYVYLPLIAIGLTTTLFIWNFLFTNGISGTVAVNSTFATICVVVSLVCFLAYFILNCLIINGKITTNTKKA